MNKVLALIKNKWDYFGVPTLISPPEFIRRTDRAVFILRDNIGNLLDVFSLSDFANNRSVCEALAKLYIERVTNEIEPDHYQIVEEAKTKSIEMLEFLYWRPNDAEGLEELILEWIEK